MTTLAKEYGLSDVAIAKRCKVHNIPPAAGRLLGEEGGRHGARATGPSAGDAVS